MTAPADPRGAYDDIVAELTATSPATASQMFGMPCLKCNGKTFAGFHHGAMVFKLNGSSHAQALSLPGARLFDPSGQNRPMKEWVEVPADHATQWPRLAQAALNYGGRFSSR